MRVRKPNSFLSGHSASYGRKCVRVYLCEGDLRRLDRMCEKRKMARGDLVRALIKETRL